MAIYTGETGPCRWSLIHGDIGEAELTGFLAYLRDLAANVRNKQLVLDMTFETPMPNAVQRRQITEILQSSPDLHIVAGHALVMTTTLGRGLLTAINWVVRPPFAEQVFSEPEAAMSWLHSRNGALEVGALRRDIRRACPEFDKLRW